MYINADINTYIIYDLPKLYNFNIIQLSQYSKIIVYKYVFKKKKNCVIYCIIYDLIRKKL